MLWGFVTWQRHREDTNRDPLVHLSLARVPPVRSGLIGMFSQNLILMGIFFVVPLYLQLVLGLSALETGIKMLPISIAMFATVAIGSRLSNRFAVRAIVQSGLIVTLAGALVLLATIKPTLSNAGFALGMALLGIGMGLMISQLGNVVQSSVEDSGRSEAGGLQYTGQQLGSSLGVALIGAIVLIGLTSTFISNVQHDPRISADVSAQVGVAAGSNTNFVSSTQIEAAAQKAGLTTRRQRRSSMITRRLNSDRSRRGFWPRRSWRSSRSASQESYPIPDRPVGRKRPPRSPQPNWEKGNETERRLIGTGRTRDCAIGHRQRQ